MKRIYPCEQDLYLAETILEVGCGVGWLSNSIAYYYQTDVTAIDFNNVAVESAKATAKILGTRVKFECADLFHYTCSPKDIVISIGVLHHTSNFFLGADCLKT